MVTKEPDSLDTLVELGCIFREKHEIFLRVINLLTILCEIDEIRKVRHSVLLKTNVLCFYILFDTQTGSLSKLMDKHIKI